MKVYLVGGAVRDSLLGLEVTERDWVVVGADTETLLNQGYQQVGKDFPVFLHPQSKEEYALARIERKVASGHGGFTFDTSSSVTLEEDLKRRDLTINAMAMDDTGQLIDPYHGQDDLNNGILRHVSDAFGEDPLRVLRVARFAARFDFNVAAETLQLMSDMVDGDEVADLTPERVWQEMYKALTSPMPERFFTILRDCGALKVLFPEIDRLFGVPQKKEYHPEVDTGIHVMMVLQAAARLSPDPVMRFAALCHDLGKGTTAADILPGHHGHEQRGEKLVKKLCQRYRIPNVYRDLAVLTAAYHTHCHRAFELKPATILRVLKAFDALRRPERLEQYLLACEADYRGRISYEDKEYPQARIFREALTAASAVTSDELVAQGYTGKELGEQLDQQRIAAITAQIASLRLPTRM